MKKLFGALSLALILSSCVKDKYDTDNIEGGISPTMAIPLINSSIKAESILSVLDSTLLKEDSDGLLRLVYSDSLFETGLSEFISIPDESISQSLKVDSVPLDDVSARSGLRLSTVAAGMDEPLKSAILNNDGANVQLVSSPEQNVGEYNVANMSQFTNITMASGILRISLENKWPMELLKVYMELKNGDNSVIDTLYFNNILPNGIKVDSTELKGKTLQSTLKANIFVMSTAATPGPVLINLTDSLIFNIDFEGITVTSGSAIIPSQEILNDTTEQVLTFSDGEKITQLNLKGGFLNYSINYSIQENSDIRIILPDATLNGAEFDETISINVSNPNPHTGSFDLTGYEFDLTAGHGKENTVRNIVIASTVSSGNVVAFDTSHKVNATITLSTLSPSYVEGYFGNQSLTLPSDSTNISIETGVMQQMEFVEPNLTLNFHNSFGADFGMTKIDLTMAQDGGSSLKLTGIPNPYIINGASSAGSTEITNLVLDNNTTNIDDAINLSPNKAIYDVAGALNPNGQAVNFATDSSKFIVTMDLSIPLYGAIKGYTILDTLEFGGETFEQLDNGILRTNIDNGFPIEGEVTLYFTDDNYLVLDSLKPETGNVIEAAPVDANGVVTGPFSKRTDFVLTKEKIENLVNTTNVIIKARLSSGNKGAVAAKIYSTYTMGIKLGVIAKINLNLSSNEE